MGPDRRSRGHCPTHTAWNLGWRLRAHYLAVSAHVPSQRAAYFGWSRCQNACRSWIRYRCHVSVWSGRRRS
jgi:hypothetical protein